MRIAVCDDERVELQNISCMLEELAGQGRLPLGPLLLRSYKSAAELLADAEAGARFDLLILDVLMPGMDGIELARRLRASGEDADIVFLTSSKEYAVDSYEVRATDYLLKPVTQQRLASALERVIQTHSRKEEMLVLSTPFRLLSVPCSQIEYVEIRGKTLHFMLLGGREEMVNAPLKDYEPQLLGKGGFVKVHRSFIVNMANIKTLTLEGVRTVEGRQVPVSRSLRKAVRETYMSYLFDDAGGGSA
ncbi:MAG: LytR/AlgR family response regulator transcription factor [Coriobacteriales bacterium]